MHSTCVAGRSKSAENKLKALQKCFTHTYDYRDTNTQQMEQIIDISQLKGYNKRAIISLSAKGRLYIGAQTAREMNIKAGDKLKLFISSTDRRTLYIEKTIDSIFTVRKGTSISFEIYSAKLAEIVFREYPENTHRVIGFLVDADEIMQDMGFSRKIIFQTPNK